MRSSTLQALRRAATAHPRICRQRKLAVSVFTDGIEETSEMQVFDVSSTTTRIDETSGSGSMIFVISGGKIVGEIRVLLAAGLGTQIYRLNLLIDDDESSFSNKNVPTKLQMPKVILNLT